VERHPVHVVMCLVETCSFKHQLGVSGVTRKVSLRLDQVVRRRVESCTDRQNVRMKMRSPLMVIIPTNATHYLLDAAYDKT